MSLTSRLQALLTYANEKTNKDNKTLGEAIKTLVDGYSSTPTPDEGIPFKYGGKNATLVSTFEESWNLSDTTFPIGGDIPTSQAVYKPTINNYYTTPESPNYDYGDKDIIIIQRGYCKPIYNGNETKKIQPIDFAAISVSYYSKRESVFGEAKKNRFTNALPYAMNRYYDSNGKQGIGNAGYGIYMTLQAASIASATLDNTYMRVGSPIIYARSSALYGSAENLKCVIDAKIKWKIEVYVVDDYSTPNALLHDDCVEMLENQDIN